MSVKNVFNTSAELDFPTVLPTLDLDFANTKALDPRITFTRSSGGSYVGADGTLKYAGVNEARFDHNPVTGESLGLLVEEQRTNLLVRSQEFDNAAVWGAVNVTVTANTVTAPDGTQTAETITDINGVIANAFLLQTVALIDSTTYSMSCFLKASTKTTARVGIRAKDGVIYAANVDLAAGTITNVNATSASIQPHQNGWYRCVVTAPSNTGATSGRGLVYLDTGSNTGTGTGSIHVWGAQLEAGAFPTSYIPTTAATATRSADVASITGANFSSWFNATQGTIYAQASTAGSAGNPYVVAINDGAASNRLEIRRIGASNQASFIVTTLGTTEAVPGVASWTARTFGRLAAAYATNDVNLAFNGALGPRDTSANLPTVTQMVIGSTTATIGINQPIRRITYWPKRLPNSQLQALTR